MQYGIPHSCSQSSLESRFVWVRKNGILATESIRSSRVIVGAAEIRLQNCSSAFVEVSQGLIVQISSRKKPFLWLRELSHLSWSKFIDFLFKLFFRRTIFFQLSLGNSGCTHANLHACVHVEYCLKWIRLLHVQLFLRSMTDLLRVSLCQCTAGRRLHVLWWIHRPYRWTRGVGGHWSVTRLGTRRCVLPSVYIQCHAEAQVKCVK